MYDGRETVKYEYRLQTVKIDAKKLAIVKRWARGAIIRRNMKKLVQCKQIQNQKKLTIKDGKIVRTDEPMMSDTELKDCMDSKKGGKGLYWNTHEVDMGKASPGATYVGQWSKDQKQSQKQGLAIIHAPDYKYFGAVKGGKPHGKGHLVNAKKGTIYQGEFKDGQADGHGTFVNKTDGTAYEGEWMNDKKHGKGVELLESGSHKFEGTFLNNSMDEGALIFDGGQKIYRGKFKDGKFDGQGTYEDKVKGFSYTGPFEEDKFHGEGKLTMRDMGYYHGSFSLG